MRNWGVSALALVLGLWAGAAQAESWKIVQAGTLIDDPAREPRRNVSVIVRDDVVQEIRNGFVTAADLAGVAADKVEIVDQKSRTVLPGLIDTHVHLASEMSERSKVRNVQYEQADYAIDSTIFARRTLEAGFTSVRNPGDELAIYALKRAIEAGKVPGPRIQTSGRIISSTGGHGQRLGYSHGIVEYFASTNTALCDGIESCRKSVREQIAEGADFIKIASTGGVLTDVASGTGQQFTDEEIRAIVEVAHMMGRKVACHAHDEAGIVAALKAGVDSIEHGSFAQADALPLFKKTGAFLVPTLLAGATTQEAASIPGYLPPSIAAKAKAVGPHMAESLGRAYKAGVRIAFGTDSGVSKHGVNAREFELMTKAGMSNKDALIAATTNAAELMGLRGKVGVIAPGAYADIVATDANPLDKITTLTDVRFVMKGGEVVKNLR